MPSSERGRSRWILRKLASMKKLDTSDHRAFRGYLTNDDYALAEGAEYVPKANISLEAWASLTNLPDTVVLMTTGAFSRAIGKCFKDPWTVL